MSRFINTESPTVQYRGNKYHNHPVNIDLCISFKKDTLKVYPDNENGIYVIKFIVNAHNQEVSWFYSDEKERDTEYNKLLQCFGVSW
jgi:hypothetical protein